MQTVQVLIVDDDRDTATFFRTVLELVGFECQVANSAKEAFNYLAAHRPDIVLLDMRLGIEVDGGDILRQLRANPRLDDTQVIVITAYPSLAETVTELADLVLTKPVEVEQLQGLTDRLKVLRRGATRTFFRDPTTGAYNQGFFLSRLEHALARAQRRVDFLFAVLQVGLDLGVLGEASGSDIQDAFCRQVAQRLRGCIRPTDTLARMAYNEFGVLLDDIKQAQDVEIVLKRMQAALEPPVQVEDQAFEIYFRAGALVFQPEYGTPEDLVAAVEGALQAAWEASTGLYVILYNKPPA